MTNDEKEALRLIVREEISAACLFFRVQDILSLSDIARNLKRTPKTIRSRLRELNLYKEHGNYSPEIQQKIADSFGRPRKSASAFKTKKR